MSERTSQENGAAPANYADARRLRRDATRKRIHEHVLHPIDTPSLLRDPLFHPTSPIDSTISSVKLLATAVAVHVLIILLFAAVNDLMGEKGDFKAPERVVVRVIESPPPPPPPPPPPKVEVIKEELQLPITPEFIPKDPLPPKKSKPSTKPKARKIVKKPDTAPPEADAPPPPKRRYVGINFESTTTGGKGPALATGTSRMGETEATAADPKLAKQEPDGDEVGSPTGKGTGAGKTTVREQRKASNIPTRDSVFVKPKRNKPSKPPYPKTLKAQGLEGDVQVRVSINTKGKVTKVAILKGSGHKAFDEAARVAALAETFTPATRDGTSVAFTLSYSYRFRIEEN